MSKNTLILIAVVAAAGGAYYYTRTHGGVGKLSEALKARLARGSTVAAATSAPAPAVRVDDKETEL